MAQVEYMPGDTPVHHMNPVTKLLFMLLIFVNSSILFDIVSLAIVFGIVGVWWVAAKIPASRLKLIFVITAFTCFLYIFSNSMIYHKNATELFRLPIDLYWGTDLISVYYLEGFVFGLAASTKIFCIVCAVPVLILTTPISDIIVGLEKIRVPWKFNFILSSALRFAPMIYRNFYEINDAQKLRGHDLDAMGWLKRVKAVIPVLTPLMLSLFRQSDELQIAIESRGFGAPVKRTSLAEIKLRALDYGVIIFLFAFTAYNIWARLTWGSLLPTDFIPTWAHPP